MVTNSAGYNAIWNNSFETKKLSVKRELDVLNSPNVRYPFWSVLNAGNLLSYQTTTGGISNLLSRYAVLSPQAHTDDYLLLAFIIECLKQCKYE